MNLEDYFKLLNDMAGNNKEDRSLHDRTLPRRSGAIDGELAGSGDVKETDSTS